MMKDSFNWAKVLMTAMVLSGVHIGENIFASELKATSSPAVEVQELIDVSGVVLDQDTGSPLEGVSIMSNNQTVTRTDSQGRFKASVQKGTTLRFSMIGYETVSQQISRSDIRISLRPVDAEIEEVIVTALGIKREEKSLGYAATVIKGEDMTDALSNNWMDALSGKVAGLNLLRSNAGPVGSTKIILRGEANLTGDNQALIIVDGVILNGASGRRDANDSDLIYGTGSDNMPADYGSNMDDINPEDIAEITVLKGPGAAALYGQRGAHGAIIITTKAGSKKDKGLGITINSNTAYESVNRWPDLQYEYGQGLDGAAHYSYGASVDGASTSGTSSAYGPKFDGQYFYQYDPVTQARGTERTLWQPYKNITDFFEVGRVHNNSITIDGGSDRTTARFSFTDNRNTWITPNTGSNRNTVAVSVSSKISDKLTVSSKVNYNRRWSENLPGAGYGNQSIMYWFIFWQPSADLNWLKDYWVHGQENLQIKYPYSSYPENPYAISYEFINRNNRNAFTGNAVADYKFNDALSLMVRGTLDFSFEDRAQERPYDAGSKLVEGSFRTQSMFNREAAFDFLLKYNKKINEDFDLSGTFGGSTLRNDYRRENMTADGLTYPGEYKMSNSKYGIVSSQRNAHSAVNSLYALATVSYKDFLFADMTWRIDWNSTMATPVDSSKSLNQTYPGVNMSFVLSDVVDLPKAFSFARFRASWADIGNGGQDPYMLQDLYTEANGLLPGSVSVNTQLRNPELKPLRTRSMEFGADLRFFKNRLNFDVAWYRSNTYDQHLNRTIDASAGRRTFLLNVGDVANKGLEVAVNTEQIKKKDGFNWSSMLTYTANRNKIVSLPDSNIILQYRSVGSGQIVATVGGSMGDMYGLGYQRAPDGQVLYDETTGNALITSDIVYLGNTMPKGKASIGNTFSYKGLRLNVLFDAQWGAVGHSLSHYKLAEQGKTTNTLPGRYSGIIGNGVIANGDGTYRQNDVIATDIDEYYRSHYGQDNAEGNTFSTDFIKFREARLDYTFPKKLVGRYNIDRATVGIYGRNLFIWTPWPIFDPEFGTLDNGDIVRGFEIAQFPSTRTFGLNLVLGF